MQTIPQDIRAVVVERPGVISLQTFPAPEIGPDEGLLKVEAAGVCGTDPKILHGKVLEIEYPLILGHENVGRIAKVGERAATLWGVKVGDRVAVESHVACGTCLDCLQGEYRTCRQTTSYGHTSAASAPHLFGGLAEYMHLRQGSILYPIPDEVTNEEAVIGVSALANGIEWTGLGGVTLGDVVVVQGVGQQGLSCVIAAKERGARYVIAAGVSIDAERLAFATRLGADRPVNVEEESLLDVVMKATNGEGADVVVDVSGSPKAVALSLDLVRRRGAIVLSGFVGKDTEVPLRTELIVWKQLRVYGGLTRGVRSMHKSMAIMASRKYDLGALITHRYTLEESEHAVKVAGGEIPGESAVKAVIFPHGWDAA